MAEESWEFESEDEKGRIHRQKVTTHIDHERGVYMISVAAELAEMHPQTLRMYEAKGLISPKRSPKNTRLYSQSDVERLRRIQKMTSEDGLNLAGVETVLNLEERLKKMQEELDRMRARARELEDRMQAEIERARQSLRGEIVPYGAYDVLAPSDRDKRKGDFTNGESRTVRIPVQRRG